MNSKIKKAFTLTELLVVLLIVGVLSAVALPKFNRVIETRRTAEAEEMLSAVRAEQEKRCSMDKPYAGTFKQVGDVIASGGADTDTASTDNYNYQLKSMGISAASRGKEYTLSIPSYREGRMCCDGDYCENLNKNYPVCNEITIPDDPCAGEVKKECSALSKPVASKSCGPCGGVRTRSVSCDTSTGTWNTGSWTACPSSICVGESSRSCPAGTQGSQTRECDCGVWGAWEGLCLKCAPTLGEKNYRNCQDGQQGMQTREWNYDTCKWGPWTGDCILCAPAPGEKNYQDCPTGTTGTQTREWNNETCSWSDWTGECKDSCQIDLGGGFTISDCECQCDHVSAGHPYYSEYENAKEEIEREGTNDFQGICQDQYSGLVSVCSEPIEEKPDTTNRFCCVARSGGCSKPPCKFNPDYDKAKERAQFAPDKLRCVKGDTSVGGGYQWNSAGSLVFFYSCMTDVNAECKADCTNVIM